MANAHVNMNFNAFLEKTKLKDDGSNYTDWVRNLRIILIAARKQYVLEGPLGERSRPREPRHYECLAVSCWWLLPRSVRHALQLRTRTSKTFWTTQSIWDVPRSWNWYFRLMPVSRGMRPLTSTLPTRGRRIAQRVSMCSKCLGTTITWIKWELIFQIR